MQISGQNISHPTLVSSKMKVHIPRNSSNSTVPISLPSGAKNGKKPMTIRTKPAQNVTSNNGIEKKDKDVNADKGWSATFRSYKKI